MRGRDILKLLPYLPFLIYGYFSFTGKLVSDINPLYLIALPVVSAMTLLLSRSFWFFIAALCAANASVQLSGGATSQLFFFYFLILFVEGLRSSAVRYFIASGIFLVLETSSALFHLSSKHFPLGPLIALAAFSLIAYLFLRREEKRSRALKLNLEKEKAKFHWLDPLTSPRTQRLLALKEENYSIDADSMYKGYVSLAFQTLKVHSALLFLIHEKNLYLVAFKSKADYIVKECVFSMGEGVVGYLAREEKASLLNDLGGDITHLGYYHSKNPPVRSLASAPVRNKDINYGIMLVDSELPLSEYHKTFLINLAELLARDIQIAAAYEERHREAMRFSGLYELAGNLLTGLTEEELINRSFELVNELFSPDAVGFARLIEKEGAELVRYEGGSDFDKGYRFDRQRSLIAMAAKHKGFLKHRDMSKPGLYRLGPGEKAPVNKTFLGISFSENEHTSGILWLEKKELDAYSEREGMVLGFAATLLSAAFMRVKFQQELARLARIDGLTGLLNHRSFQEELESAINKYGTVALFIIDIDHFKKVNDTYGHPVGDKVLKKVAEVIKDKGIAARYGGEEFALIVPNILSQQMLGRGEEILSVIRRAQIKIREGTIQVTASVGAAFYPTDRRNREELVRAADTALYKAKTSGRDRLVLLGK